MPPCPRDPASDPGEARALQLWEAPLSPEPPITLSHEDNFP